MKIQQKTFFPHGKSDLKHGFSNTVPNTVPKKHGFFDKNTMKIAADFQRFLAILAVILHYFRCIFTKFTQIKKIKTDLKTQFDGGYRKLIHLGTW